MIIEVKGKELLNEFLNLGKKMEVIEQKIKPIKMEESIERMKEQLTSHSLWNDKELYKRLTKEIKLLEKKLFPYRECKNLHHQDKKFYLSLI